MSVATKLVPVVDGTAGTPIDLQDGRISVVGTPAAYDVLMYNSTSGKFENSALPAIPSAANNGILTLQQNGTTLGTFSADQSSNQTINVTTKEDFVCTFTYQIDDNSEEDFPKNAIWSCDKTIAQIRTAVVNGDNVLGKITVSENDDYIMNVLTFAGEALSNNNYGYLFHCVCHFGVNIINFMLIGSRNNNADRWNADMSFDLHDVSNLNNLAEVATSGDYNDLFDKPTFRTISHEQITDSTLGDINIHDGYYFPNAVQDYDGNWYGAVVVGDQVWLGENLRTTHYSDGTAITKLSGDNSSNTAYYYEIDNVDERLYGYLYSWITMMNGASASTTNPSGVQGIAPIGWHVPSMSEFSQLSEYLGKQSRFTNESALNIAKALATDNTSVWDQSNVAFSPGINVAENNATGLNFVPAGRVFNGYSYKGQTAFFWCTDEGTVNNIATNVNIYYAKSIFLFDESGCNKTEGFSVRCVCDLSPVQFRNWYVAQYGSMQHHVNPDVLPSITGNSGKVLAVNSGATGVEWVAQQGSSVTVDTALSETSTNPVQNKAINVLTRKLWQNVDIVSRLGDEYPTTRNQISNGVWSSSTTYKHWAVPVDGLRLVSVTANNSQFAILTFLKTYNNTSGTPDYATGYIGNTTVDAGKTKLFNVPSDANYMIIMSGSSNARKPSNVLLTGVAINHPALGYINMASNASSCNITLTDTKQSFIIDNSANSNTVSVAVTTQVTSIYSHRMLAVDKNSISQFDFEITETGQNTILSVIQQVLLDQT